MLHEIKHEAIELTNWVDQCIMPDFMNEMCKDYMLV